MQRRRSAGSHRSAWPPYMEHLLNPSRYGFGHRLIGRVCLPYGCCSGRCIWPLTKESIPCSCCTVALPITNFQHYRAGEHSLRSIVFNSGQDFSCQIYLPKYIFSLELVISNGTYSELISMVVIDEFDIDWAQAKIHTNGGTRVLTREYNLRRSPYSLKLSGERSLVITRACVGIEGWTFVLTQFIKNYSTLPELQSTQLVSPLHYPPLRGRQAQYLT